MSLRVLIVGAFRFPLGTAPASRIRHLSFGLQRAGASVRVLTLCPVKDIHSTGIYQGIRYKSACASQTSGRPSSTIHLALRGCSAMIRARRWIGAEVRAGHFDLVLLYHPSALVHAATIGLRRSIPN